MTTNCSHCGMRMAEVTFGKITYRYCPHCSPNYPKALAMSLSKRWWKR